MKVWAYTKRENRTKNDRVTAWEIYHKKKKSPSEYRGKKYYSTHHNINDVKEMIHYNGRDNRKPNPFFQYCNLEDRNVGDGESITHEYIKEMISELHELNFIVNDKNIRIFVKEAYTEYRIDTDSNQYIVDIFVEFEKSEPFYYFEKWLGILAIEIYVSHKTEYQKKIDLKKIGVPIAEVSIPSSWDLEQYYGDENLFNKKISEMKKMFENKIYAQLISDPESDYYRVKKENIYLKDEIRKLKIKLEEKEINSTNDKKTLMSQIDGLKSEKILLNQKIENSKTEFESLRSEKESIESKLIINKIRSIFKWNK